MKLIRLRIENDAMDIAYHPVSGQTATAHYLIAYNSDQTIGENLENIKVRLAGLQFDAAILENGLSYPFSDTIVGVNYDRIDVGLALTNLLNIPVVSQTAVDQLGLAAAVKAKSAYLKWHLDYYGQYHGVRNNGQEAMLTIGNGYFGLRGAFLESHADKDNYPGTYVAGVYDQTTTTVHDHQVKNEDLVNLPNAQFMTFGIDHQTPFTLNEHDLQDAYRSLDLKTGLLTTTKLIQLASGHQLRIRSQKVANMRDWHRYSIRYQVTPLNFAGSLQIYTEIDGSVVNSNVSRYNVFDQHHLKTMGIETAANTVYLSGQTKSSHINYTIGAKLTSPDVPAIENFNSTQQPQGVQQTVSLAVEAGKTYTFDKNVVIATSNDHSDPQLTHVQAELDQSSFDNTVTTSKDYWEATWRATDIKIRGDITSQRLLRVNIYHSFVSAAAIESGQLDASVGARGLHGEAYRGHVFWDEMFILPFYTLHRPELAKQLLAYRYRRLPMARKNAEAEGYAGAMYPWQSASKGDEQSQFTHLNPITKTWDPDNSRLQRHVSLDIAYNVWFYYHVTQDRDFLTHYGMEMLLSIAAFWISKADYDQANGRYNISGVMGPDEFHENYPNSTTAGLKNNAYTNIMVAWLFDTITTLRAQMPQAAFQAAAQAAQFDSTAEQALTTISHQLTLEINRRGIIAQFEGYFNLPTLDFQAYRQKYGDIARMDRILKAESKTPDAYQVAKQTDALMAFYNFDVTTVQKIIEKMGYQLPKEYLTHNIQYYLARTTHGSTLSRIVYAVLNQLDDNDDDAWKLFSEALASDYYDIQGGTTAEGIHLGVMCATLNLTTRNFGGVNPLGAHLQVNPRLPEHWQTLKFKHLFRGVHYVFVIDHQRVTVTADQPSTIMIGKQQYQLQAKKPLSVTYTD
ncbi:glycoside hydrolase family 65 protein [Lactiplantibacillus argentoratensis]|uniref:Glycoside hydrolase family 65 protein n=1 Tax=Lactiplantibacillus argentoratensis TaxID=271881 RepID=A0AAN1PZ61_9LACO|nr:glycosyl hydrolase family 65 protein [Lactiplantibacillus argentoratensis]KTF00795.1 Trehalose 6-phosphate phosphorylase [Lactiplantibacillus plantarum]GEK62442.1 kojibiose phosphorylase [Lactobacillus japonicus]AYJ34286.1 glycoside hydrolase family 65 protein [Lactiplantibacillus argentoratensis]KZT83201.1 Trehalose 6-phosphate phosphorylase [Lactiplantibacillus plantarum]MCT4443896.1 glycoside hydrolase family 65 protein [Lactiplantibacillus argentoratensis]